MRELRNYGLAAVCASVLVAAGCGSDSDQPAPAVEPDPPPPVVEPDPEPTPTGMIDSIPPTTGLAKAGSMELHIPAGEYDIVGGVKFMCAAGEAACDVSLMVGDDGSVSGTWTGGEVMAMFVDPAEEMNDANAMTVAGMMMVDFDAPRMDEMPAVPGSPHSHMSGGNEGPPEEPMHGNIHGHADDGVPLGGAHSHNGDDVIPAMPATPDGVSTIAMVGGLRDGVWETLGSADDSMVSVTDMLDPNYGMDSMVAAPGDDIGMEMAGAVALEGWDHRVLHADWGDTSVPGRDGGFETLAAVYSDLQDPMPVSFWDVAVKVANDDSRMWFTREAADDGRAGMAVAINGMWHDGMDGMDGMWKAVEDDSWEVAVDTVVFTVQDSLVADRQQVRNMHAIVEGTYFGASGTFECMTDVCTISREMTGDMNFGVADTNGPAPGHGERAGVWHFTPGSNAMVNLPDQDWMAFGFWLTTPTTTNSGTHRLGVFYDGMDMYDYYEAITDSVAPLTGMAMYDGSAAGYYVNGEESGMFTARAHLSANFVTHMLGGRIDNFRDSMGRYLGSDTRLHANDPMEGGENDWVVLLNNSNIVHGRSAGMNGTSGMVRETAEIDGSADGVEWTGQWSAQLYGGGDRMMGNPAPSGVGGNFRAVTDMLMGGGYKGVVGAFGAALKMDEMDEH